MAGKMQSSFLRSSPPSSLSTDASDSATLMEDKIADAEEIITRWDPQGSSSDTKVTSLFQESRAEARLFLGAVDDLRRAMRFFAPDSQASGSSGLLDGVQTLVQAAMRRLQKEFHQILSANRLRVYPESLSASGRSTLSLNSTASSPSDLEEDDREEDETRFCIESTGDAERVSALAMADLRSIADCMISSGNGEECTKIYKLVRRSIVDEDLHKLGFERPTLTQLQKLDSDVVDTGIRSWLAASKVAVRTLFAGERVLCDEVFGASDSIHESLFAEIAVEPAVQFFGFPEMVASMTKRSPEKIFRILDMYDSVSELWPEIESVFSYGSTSAVRSQAASSLLKLGVAVRSLFGDLESAIQKDNSKTPVPGGGLHPLSRYVMNYAAFLADYSSTLETIFGNHPLQATPTPIPESFFEARDGGNNLCVRMAWLVLVLLCKLDSKAELYGEPALAYLFLANNLQYVVDKVRGSKLSGLLGDGWVAKQEAKARGYASSYERLAWSNVRAALPQSSAAIAEMDAHAARLRIRRFNEAFAEAYRGQSGWVVVERRMREELKLSIARKVVAVYRPFYERCRLLLRGERDSSAVVRFAPGDLANYISDLFDGAAATASIVSSVPGSSVSGSSVRQCRST